MIKNWLSRYAPRYPRSLVYMLQASEYDLGAYLAWLGRTRDFARVERRAHLMRTPKAIALLAFCWIMIAVLVVLDIGMLRIGAGPLKYAAFFLILLTAPLIVAFGIIVPLLVIKMVQRPIEFFIIRRVRQTLRDHRAVKIGIAGSFGKTTMREILKTVLSEGKKVAAPPQSYNTPLGISRFVRTLAGDEDVLIFELGEYAPGDVRYLCGMIRPDIGVITGINEAHLKKFKTLDRTVKTIYELADFLGEKPVYVNGESKLARENARPGHMVYSREGLGSWRVENPETGLAGTSFVFVKNDIRLALRSPLLGLHQIGPLAAAADIALNAELSRDQIAAGIAKTRPFEHRLEPKTDAGGVVTLDDSYNGNPDGVAAVIDFLCSLAGRRRWYVTPGLVEMGTRTEEVHKEVGRRLARSGIEKVVLMQNSVTPFIAAGLKEAGYAGEILWFDDALTAFAALPHLTAKGDVVLLQNDWPDQYQ